MRLSFMVAAVMAGCALFEHSALAAGVQFGVTAPIIMKAKDPEGVYGYRGIVTFQPTSWVGEKATVYLAASFGHWWVHGASVHRSLNIYAFAPVLRYYLKKSPTFSPYVEASIGPSWMTRTYLGDHHNLGMHYAFQDEVGIGAAFGKDQQWFVTLSALHYSNGSLASNNSGITIPAILNLGYRFG